MRSFVYTAKDPNSHKQLGKFAEQCESGDWLVTFKRNRPIRSLKANAFFWAVIKIYAMHTGHTEKEIDYMFRMDRHWEEVTNPKTGRSWKVPKQTHDRDTAEFAAIINNLLQWGREEFPEVIIPRREDLTYQQWMEINNQYDRTFAG